MFDTTPVVDAKSTNDRRPVVAVRYPVWSSYCPQVLKGVVAHMREGETWQLVTGNNSHGEMESVSLDGNWKGDGIILFRATEQELDSFRKRGVAVVLTSTEGPDGGFPRVVPDNFQIGRKAAAHLMECAVRHFAYLARGETIYREAEFAPGTRRYARHRLKGFCDELQGYSIEPRVHYLKGRPLWQAVSWRKIQEEVMAFLKTLPPHTGLFVVDDALGAVVLRAADALGISVPASLAIVGFGNDPSYCYSAHPTLSTIPFPGFEIGRIAAQVLHRQMQGEAINAIFDVPISDIVQRDSSNMLVIPDEHISKLVRHIRLAAPRDSIQVAELARISSLSLTTVKARFAHFLGRSPKQEIQRVRLQHLMSMLDRTDLSLSQIATQMRFSSVHELSRFFLAQTGRRPAEYRKEKRATQTVRQDGGQSSEVNRDRPPSPSSSSVTPERGANSFGQKRRESSEDSSRRRRKMTATNPAPMRKRATVEGSGTGAI